MKIELKDEPDTFKPFDIVVRVESKEEAAKLTSFMALNKTVPDAVKVAVERDFVKDFMGKMHSVLLNHKR